jgi:hypothetical protein
LRKTGCYATNNRCGSRCGSVLPQDGSLRCRRSAVWIGAGKDVAETSDEPLPCGPVTLTTSARRGNADIARRRRPARAVAGDRRLRSTTTAGLTPRTVEPGGSPTGSGTNPAIRVLVRDPLVYLIPLSLKRDPLSSSTVSAKRTRRCRRWDPATCRAARHGADQRAADGGGAVEARACAGGDGTAAKVVAQARCGAALMPRSRQFRFNGVGQTISTSRPSLATSQSCNSLTLPSMSGDMCVKISRLAPIIGNFSRRVA